MWLFTRYGFFSIGCASKDNVKSRGIDPNLLMVRARQHRHLENLKRGLPILGDCVIKENAGTDYRYRMFVPKDVWGAAVAELVQEQTWDNFKNEAKRFLGSDYDDYVKALHRVWSIMADLQPE
jgi:hypothetical protein